MEPGRDDIDNSDRDELAGRSPHFGPLLSRNKSTAPTRMVDAADAAILGSPQKVRVELTKPPRRLRRQLDPEEDELALGTPTAPRNPRRATSKTANTGAVQATEQNNSHEPLQKARQVVVRLESALCQPNHRYIKKGAQGWCSLGEVERASSGANQLQLCACSREGNLLPDLDWLEVTKRVKLIQHNPESTFVKIWQSTAGNVGANMVFQFFAADEAKTFVQWVKENLDSEVSEEERY